MNLKNGKSYILLSNALRQIIMRPQYANALKAKETRAETIKKLQITEDIATEIFNILNVIEQNQKYNNKETNQTSTFTESDETEKDKEFLLESFKQLRTAYRISMIMSSAIFIIGMAFLVLATIRSIIDPKSIAITSIIGGIGIVQIVTLFYRNPLADIARIVSNAQQAKITVMSYLIGVSLLNQQIGLEKPSKEHLHSLINLTEITLFQLQKYIEKDLTTNIENLKTTSSKNKKSKETDPDKLKKSTI